MNSKFKVGQKIKVVSTYYKDSTGTIAATPTLSTAFYYVHLDGANSNWFTESELELVTETLPGTSTFMLWSEWNEQQKKKALVVCECGSTKTLGTSDHPLQHSSWCPIKMEYNKEEV